MQNARKNGILRSMKRWHHTLIGAFLLMGLGYTHCTGGLLAIPYSLAAEHQPQLSEAATDQFACFSEMLMSYAQDMSVDAEMVIPEGKENGCDTGACRDTAHNEQMLPSRGIDSAPATAFLSLPANLPAAAPFDTARTDRPATEHPPSPTPFVLLLKTIVLRT